jgi:hypothetical protein
MRYRVAAGSPDRIRVSADRLALGVLVVLGVGTLYETAVALEILSIGALPGQGAPLEGLFVTASLIAALAGIVLACWLAVMERESRPAALLAPATAAFMIARYYTFDSYYAPNLQRYSEGGFSPPWVYGLSLVVVATSLLALKRARIGFACTAVVTLLCVFSASFFGFGK